MACCANARILAVITHAAQSGERSISSCSDDKRSMAKEDSFIQEKSETTDRETLQEPPLYKVLLHNDDYTTMDFVVMILQTVFHKSTDEATRIMLNVHHQGVGVAGIYTREIGETKVEIVHRMAKRNQFPLRCSLEQDR